ncbi:uncharacterized protein [Montipora capricornis]|uniref:uncharacterized protein n=1 Tax=Montipora foliosa TaxID=591990 RepID=UPI0035F1B5C3
MKKKRPVGSPSGSTPGNPSNKVAREACNSRSRKSLSFGNEVGLQSEDTSVRATWTDREIKSLVQYIALFCDLGEDCGWVEKPWPHTKSTLFWDSCAEAIAEHTGLPIRSGNAC